jgi:rRNA maturation RNase YbeY
MAAERASGTVVIAFVDESEIAGLNACYRGLDEPTDVLSFSYIDADGEWPVQLSAPPGVDVDISDDDRLPDLGEVVVCPAVVLRYALEDGDDPAAIGVAVLHGVYISWDMITNTTMRDARAWQALLGELDRL